MLLQGFEKTPIPEPLPLSPVEDLFWRLEGSSQGSFRVNILMRLEGRMDVTNLEAALRALQRRHPKLRAVVSTHADGQSRYKFSGPSRPIPLRVIEYDGAEPPWREETRRLLHEPFPAHGPPIRATLLCSRAADASDLILCVHHAIADGLSVITLMDDLLAAYAAVELPDVALSLPPVTAKRARTTGKWSDRKWLLRRLARLQGRERQSALTRLPEADKIQSQSQWVLWIFSREETLKLVRACRREQTSIGGLLIAAVLCALMDCLKTSRSVFKWQFPFDLREELVGNTGSVTSQDVGCFASVMNELYELEVRPALWDLARRVHSDIQAFKQRGGPSVYYNSVPVLTRLFRVATAVDRLMKRFGSERPSAATQRPTLFTSSYGVLKLRDQYGSLRPRACTLMFDQGKHGPTLVAEALVLGQELNIGFAGDGLEPAFWNELHTSVHEHLSHASGYAGQRIKVAAHE